MATDSPDSSKAIMSSQTRLLEFDIIKGMAIFLVIWGHAILHFSSSPAKSNTVFTVINSFHMPLFMLISGFFSNKALHLPFSALIKKKFYQLLWPCISFGILFILVVLGLDYLDDIKTLPQFSILFYSLWFLKSTFLCFLIMWIILKISRDNLGITIVLTLVASQLIPIFKINWMLPFFLLGYLLNLNIDKFKKNLWIIFFTSLFSFCFAYYMMRGFYQQGGEVIMEMKDRLLHRDMSILGEILCIQLQRIVIGISGSLAALSGIFLICRSHRMTWLTNELKILGKETLGIYIMQTLLLEIILSRFIDLSLMDTTVFSLLLCPLISWAIMDFCGYIVRIIHSHSGWNYIFFHTKCS